MTKNCNICTPKRGNEHPSRQDLWGRNINYFEKQETRGRKKVRNRDNFNFFWKKKRQNNYLNSPHNWKACYLKQMTRRSGVVTSSHKKKLLYTRTWQKIFVCKTPGIYFKLLPQTVKFHQRRKNIHIPVCNGLNIT